MIGDKEVDQLVTKMYKMRYELWHCLEEIEHQAMPDKKAMWVHKSACEISALISAAPTSSEDEPF